METKADYVFEVSFEVCNKVGGIYTVVKSKAAAMKTYYKNYFLIGPYYNDRTDVEFLETEIPEKFREIDEKLKKEGIICHFGKWQIKGEPDTILVDFMGTKDSQNELQKMYWEKYKVDSISSSWDFIEPMLWSTAVGKLIECFGQENKEKKIIGHFHEWLSGFGSLWLKSADSHVKTVFTTHATMLGRSIAGNGRELYNELDNIEPEKTAKELGVMDKFSTEKACAENSDIFTTVSEITGIEAEKLLGKKPDVLVLNGLDEEKFPSFEETSLIHISSKDKIREFLTYFFFPYYQFDMDHTLTFFIVGRYEFRNKGIDLFIKALARLNNYLKEKNSKRTIAALFWIPGDARGIRTELLENKTFYRHIKNYVESHSKEIEKKIVMDIVSNKDLTRRTLFSKEFLISNKRHLNRFRREGNPPISTHYLGNEAEDPIEKALRENNLVNNMDDNVKVVHYPVYLNGVDGLIDLPYYEAMCGCHLGVFPSYYEPWGYTPVECASMGVPSLTSDLAGFGRFIKPKLKDREGIYVLERFGKSEEESLKNFTDFLCRFSELDHHERVKYKMDAKGSTQLTDWRDFVKFYVEAHNKALLR
ncbi:MAG: glycogen/starch synthase [Candidatus Woesearchaeota archaeon]